MTVPSADVFGALLDLERAADSYEKLAHSLRPGFPDRLDPALQRSLRRTGDATSTLNALKDLEDRLLALEDSIRSTRNMHRLARTTLENYLTPIAVLPTEILLHVFSFAASDNDMSMIWTSQTCRHWRSITIDQPDLWMYPPTGCKAPILQLYVDRSGQRSLDLKLDGNRARWARVKGIVSTIAPRLRLLEWSSSAGDIADPDVALDPVEDSEDALDEIESMQWPILEVLHLRHNVARRPHSFREYDVLQARLPLPTSVPVLRELQLQGMLVWRSLEAFPSLRSLCVRRFTPSRAFIVQYLPSLQVEKLHLESGIGRVWSTGILVSIALHSLTALHLMDCGLEIMSYFANRASFPKLAKMVLVDRASSLALGWDPDDGAKLIRSTPSLTQLQLCCPPIQLANTLTSLVQSHGDNGVVLDSLVLHINPQPLYSEDRRSKPLGSHLIDNYPEIRDEAFNLLDTFRLALELLLPANRVLRHLRIHPSLVANVSEPWLVSRVQCLEITEEYTPEMLEYQSRFT